MARPKQTTAKYGRATIPGADPAGTETLSVNAADLLPRGICIHNNCKVCRLAQTNEPLQHELNVMLLQGFRSEAIIAHAAAHGLAISGQSLTRHRTNHLMPTVFAGTVRHAEITAITSQLGDIQDGNIAVVLSRLLCITLLPAVGRLTEDDLRAMAPEKLMELAAKVSGAAGRIQAGDAMTRLRNLELQLKTLQLSSAQRAEIQAGIAALRQEARADPELWARLEPMLQQLATTVEADPAVAPALPEAADDD